VELKRTADQAKQFPLSNFKATSKRISTFMPTTATSAKTLEKQAQKLASSGMDLTIPKKYLERTTRIE
jgi:hypothetical protein